ncbi:helix-turn-helix domain-containing protein [Rhodococcoides kroppenstedtii]|uniref:helix-turn-helix domain-containing protein n=1 Tax=Rhodococcoides kroppenstedtii TaxID=293050 RepID=UPI001BDE29A0|nr:helix-turn-helix transcriptional regulator [Rhodococcus kroppenstedtii]
MADEARQRGNEAGAVTAAVAANVAALRAERGWSRQQLADRATAAGRRFTPDAIQKLESNARRVDVDDLATLAGVLDVAPSELLGIGVAKGRTTLRDALAFGQRNPALHAAVLKAVTQNGESVAAIVDYVDFTARMAPAVAAVGGRTAGAVLVGARAAGDFAEWITRLDALDDAEAARAIADQLGDAPGKVDREWVAEVVGQRRAETVHRLLAEMGRA